MAAVQIFKRSSVGSCMNFGNLGGVRLKVSLSVVVRVVELIESGRGRVWRGRLMVVFEDSASWRIGSD